jgi:hypothetical protein
MKLALQAMGKTSFKELSHKDLVSLDENISKFTDIDYVLK